MIKDQIEYTPDVCTMYIWTYSCCCASFRYLTKSWMVSGFLDLGAGVMMGVCTGCGADTGCGVAVEAVLKKSTHEQKNMDDTHG